ncbi:uncharacterized protein ACNS7B_006895 [Menidia menidia]
MPGHQLGSDLFCYWYIQDPGELSSKLREPGGLPQGPSHRCVHLTTHQSSTPVASYLGRLLKDAETFSPRSDVLPEQPQRAFHSFQLPRSPRPAIPALRASSVLPINFLPNVWENKRWRATSNRLPYLPALCSFRYRGSVLVEPVTERQSHNMDPSEKPEQTDGVQPNHLSPTDLLAATVAGHAKQLELLTTQLNHAFTHLSTEIRTMRASVHSSTDELTRLSGLVAHFPETHPPAPLNPSPVLAPDPSALPSGSTISSNPALLLPDPRLEPNLPCPKSFGGEFGQCRGFLGQCELLFRHQPSRYSAGGARIALIMSLLTDRALAWAIAATSRDLQLTIDYPAFLREFRLVFDHPMDGPDAASRLHSISQGSRWSTASTCVWSCGGCWRTASLSRLRSANFTLPLLSTWATFWRGGVSALIPRRCVRWRNGHVPRTARSSGGSWGLQISTADSFVISVGSLHPYLR